MSYITLGYADLAIAAFLVILNGGLSIALNLGLERQLAIATLRMIVQLLLVGLVLTALFSVVSPIWTTLAALVMVLFAGREIMARQERRLSCKVEPLPLAAARAAVPNSGYTTAKHDASLKQKTVSTFAGGQAARYENRVLTIN